MLNGGKATPASSAWEISIIVVIGKVEKTALCIDYRPLNRRMKRDRFLLPNMEEILKT